MMLSLHPEHCVDLRKSGLSDETIREAGIYSVRPGDISKKLGYDSSNITSLLAFHYPGCDGFERYKPFPVIPGRAKYLQKKGSGNHLYIPPKVRSILQDRNIGLIFAEGEKKALKASQEGLYCIGLSGLWNWSDGNKKLIQDFDQISLEGRTVFICPDSDWLDSNRNGYPKNLQQSVYAFGRELSAGGAKIFIKELPKGPQSKKVGLDDYLLDHTVEDFNNLPAKTISQGSSPNDIFWNATMENEKNLPVTDIHFAAFASLNNYPIRFESKNGRVSFLFPLEEQFRELVQRYYNNEPVPVFNFVGELKKIKTMMYKAKEGGAAR